MAYLQRKLRTCLWFPRDGDKAADFYVSLLPDSAIEGGHGPAGGPPLVIEFTLAGAPMMILNAQGAPAPGHAASISVLTEDQAETDRLWDILTSDGGTESQCGWVKDRFGLSWQIVPRRATELLSGSDAAKVFPALMKMGKIEIATLEAAAA